MRRMPRLTCSLLVLLVAAMPAVVEAKPLRVFILAGQMSYYVDSKHKDHANADGSMSAAQKRDYLKDQPRR